MHCVECVDLVSRSTLAGHPFQPIHYHTIPFTQRVPSKAISSLPNPYIPFQTRSVPSKAIALLSKPCYSFQSRSVPFTRCLDLIAVSLSLVTGHPFMPDQRLHGWVRPVRKPVACLCANRAPYYLTWIQPMHHTT